MTDEQMRIAIAEACGFYFRGTATHCLGSQWPWKQWYNAQHTEVDNIPNYPTDLNAMHEAEKELTSKQMVKYRDWLAENDDVVCDWNLVHATARQRAEAFLRTIGKWKD